MTFKERADAAFLAKNLIGLRDLIINSAFIVDDDCFSMMCARYSALHKEIYGKDDNSK